MSAVSRAREAWSGAKLRLSMRRRFGTWGILSPVLATGTNAEILPYEALQEERYKLARAAASRLDAFQSRSPRYPQASRPRQLATLGFRHNSTVRACIDLLCRSATQANPVVENLDGTPARGDIPDAIRELIAFPSGRTSNGQRGTVGPILWYDLYWRLVQDLYNSGNGMLEWADGNGTADPVQIWRMAPERTYIQPDPERWIRNYVLEFDGVPFEVPLRRVVHMRFWDPLDEFFGVPPLFSGLRDLATDNELTDFTKVTLQNLGVPPAVMEFDLKEMAAANMQLDPFHKEDDRNAIREMRDRLWDYYGGRNRGKMAVAFGYKIRLLGMDMKTLDASSLVRISESRIASVHGVPMALLNRSSPDPDKPGAVYRQAKEQFFSDTVSSLVLGIESIFSPRIVAAFDPLMQHRIRFDLSGVDVLRENRLKRAREAGQVFQSSLLSRHACQKLAGQPTDGEDVFVPLQGAKPPIRMPGDQGEEVGP